MRYSTAAGEDCALRAAECYLRAGLLDKAQSILASDAVRTKHARLFVAFSSLSSPHPHVGSAESGASAPEAHLLGLIAQVLGRLEVSEEHLSTAVALEPSNPVFVADLARAVAASGRCSEAMVMLEKVPSSSETHMAALEIGMRGEIPGQVAAPIAEESDPRAQTLLRSPATARTPPAPYATDLVAEFDEEFSSAICAATSETQEGRTVRQDFAQTITELLKRWERRAASAAADSSERDALACFAAYAHCAFKATNLGRQAATRKCVGQALLVFRLIMASNPQHPYVAFGLPYATITLRNSATEDDANGAMRAAAALAVVPQSLAAITVELARHERARGKAAAAAARLQQMLSRKNVQARIAEETLTIIERELRWATIEVSGSINDVPATRSIAGSTLPWPKNCDPPVLLLFIDADCPYCPIAFSRASDWIESRGSSFGGLYVLGVGATVEHMRGFAESADTKSAESLVSCLPDRDARICSHLAIRAAPTFCVIGCNGKILAIQEGLQGFRAIQQRFRDVPIEDTPPR